MASRAIARVTAADRSGGGTLGGLRNHLATVVVAARLADVVGQLELAAVRALDQIDRRQAMMRTAHVTPRLRDLSFWYCHHPRPCPGGAVCAAPCSSSTITTASASSRPSSPNAIFDPS